MDMMVNELESDMKDGEYEEKTSAEDYKELMANSQATRQANTKSITEKNGAKAQMEGKLTDLEGTLTATNRDLSDIAGTLQGSDGRQTYGLRGNADCDKPGLV